MSTRSTHSTVGNGKGGERYISITVSLSTMMAIVNLLLNASNLSGYASLMQSQKRLESICTNDGGLELGEPTKRQFKRMPRQ